MSFSVHQKGINKSLLLYGVLTFPALLLPLSGLPGGGMNNTRNMLAVLIICGSCIGLVRFLPRLAQKTARLIFTGFLLLNLPSLWTPAVFRPDALYRLTGTAALAGLLTLLLPLALRGGLRRRLYAVVVSVCILQSALACWQVLLPASAARWLGYNFIHAGGRATGAFGQANLLGSFLATGLICALWLMLSFPARRRQSLAAVSVVIIVAGLTLSESRSAWLGTTLGVSVLMLCAPDSRLRFQAAFVLAAGLLAGMAASSVKPAVVPVMHLNDATTASSVTVSGRLAADRAASGRERLALIQGTIRLITDHPLTGNGIGSFETAFPSALARSGHINPFPVTVTHPHNEFLYVWSEGGVVALAGLLCWLALWAIPFRSLPALLRRRPSSRHMIARGALTLPLMVHVMTEFPFYLSATHGVLMVILLWLALPATARRGRRFFQPHTASVRLVQVLVAACCLGGMAFMATALQSAICIREAERTLLHHAHPLEKVLNPLAQPERLQFDLAEENLLRFDSTRNVAWLDRFQQQAGAWLAVHNDAYLTNAMMRISQAQQQRLQAAYWRQRGCLSFHNDPHFQCTLGAPDGIKEPPYHE